MDQPKAVVPKHCERCGRTVTPSQAEADMLAELEKTFPGLKPEARTVLCKVCYPEPIQ